MRSSLLDLVLAHFDANPDDALTVPQVCELFACTKKTVYNKLGPAVHSGQLIVERCAAVTYRKGTGQPVAKRKVWNTRPEPTASDGGSTLAQLWRP
jgi:hypothetical protein